MNKNFKGVIITESLENQDILQKIKILETRVVKVTEKHKTPWIKQWTLHTVEILESQSDEVSEELSRALDSKHNWYIDYKNDDFHYIIFRDKIFKVNRSELKQYKEVVEYGLLLGIPDYQLDFTPNIEE